MATDPPPPSLHVDWSEHFKRELKHCGHASDVCRAVLDFAATGVAADVRRIQAPDGTWSLRLYVSGYVVELAFDATSLKLFVIGLFSTGPTGKRIVPLLDEPDDPPDSG